ncbi:hypothetical protein DFH06DRAFT_511401 [Mycena polygramma]|nr:hypothetical protein DFH06DRAFT_511401 [Mycena polygramma]
MDPLKPSDLWVTEDWAAFSPDMKGYIPPHACALQQGYTSIEKQLRASTTSNPEHMRDAFCLWRHQLNTGATASRLILFFLKDFPESVVDLEETDDANLLCHLAPLAKAYGFTIYLGRLEQTLSTKQKVPHQYKDHFNLESEIDTSELELSDEPEEDHAWEDLLTLAGDDSGPCDPVLMELASSMVEDVDELYDRLMEMEVDDDQRSVQIVDESNYSTTVIYEESRSASFLFVVA